MKKAKWNRIAEANAKPESLWDEVARVERETLTVRPPMSFTTNEYADQKGISRHMAGSTLERLSRLGKLVKHKTPGSTKVYWSVSKV